MPKIIKVVNVSRSYSKNNTGTVVLRRGVVITIAEQTNGVNAGSKLRDKAPNG